jgi:hypothetical protein
VLDAWPHLVQVAVPADPITGSSPLADARVFEWLDRPPVAAGPERPVPRAEDLPRVLASVVSTPHVLRVSSPDPVGFGLLTEPGYEVVASALSAARREKSPLPIAFADAALATFRLPAGLDDPGGRASLQREVVEHYYENLWIHQPRVSLDGESPLASAGRADAAARARLFGVIRFREQLGTRPSHQAIYQGYPFDRLRRRLGLIAPAEASATLDSDDLSCASAAELDAFDPSTLAPHLLADAVRSSAGLRDDRRTARFAATLATREPRALAGLDAATVYAPLVRSALRDGDPEEALRWLSHARASAAGEEARTFSIWSAEVHARTGHPDAALAIYQDWLARAADPAALALDGAETLLDSGYPGHAIPLLIEARERGDRRLKNRAEALLREAADQRD